MISCADLRALEGITIQAAEVVYAFVAVGDEPSAPDEALLDREERARSMRFLRAADRRRFVLSHAALRLFVARCLDVPPVAVHYETGARGKPRLGPSLAPLEFNLSHSGAWALLAAARERPVGVDVEQVRDVPEVLSVADTQFSAAEREALRSLPPGERQVAFFRAWTREEAVIKATGEGLGRDLGSFDVGLAPVSAPAPRDGRSGTVAGWSLRDLRAPDGYAAAGAVAVSPGSPSPPWRKLSGEGLGPREGAERMSRRATDSGARVAGPER